MLDLKCVRQRVREEKRRRRPVSGSALSGLDTCKSGAACGSERVRAHPEECEVWVCGKEGQDQVDMRDQ